MNQAATPEDSLLTAKEAAKILACSQQHVLRLAILGILPAIDLAPPKSKQRMWRFRRDTLTAWLDENEGRNSG